MYEIRDPLKSYRDLKRRNFLFPVDWKTEKDALEDRISEIKELLVYLR